MQLLEFIEAVDLNKQSEAKKAELLCFYYYKENNTSSFSMHQIADWLEECGFNQPNVSRLKANLIKGGSKCFRLSKSDKSTLEFLPVALQKLDKEFSRLWIDTVTIPESQELLEEAKFCGKNRPYLDRLIRQINFTYSHNCYDACAVLMRRVFEILLVLAYQNKGLEKDISNPDGSHKMLEGIVKNAVQNKQLGIPTRISKNFDAFRNVGNNSAHSITYTAGHLDIDNIAMDYRVMMDDLYIRAGII